MPRAMTPLLWFDFSARFDVSDMRTLLAAGNAKSFTASASFQTVVVDGRFAAAAGIASE
jgi:hypothetical protein